MFSLPFRVRKTIPLVQFYSWQFLGQTAICQAGLKVSPCTPPEPWPTCCHCPIGGGCWGQACFLTPFPAIASPLKYTRSLLLSTLKVYLQHKGTSQKQRAVMPQGQLCTQGDRQQWVHASPQVSWAGQAERHPMCLEAHGWEWAPEVPPSEVLSLSFNGSVNWMNTRFLPILRVIKKY